MSLQVVDHAGELGVSARRHGDVVDGIDELRDRGLHCNKSVSILIDTITSLTSLQNYEC